MTDVSRDSTRDMTRAEARMASAVAACPLLRHSEHRTEIRALHWRTFTSNRYITVREARLLRACVTAFKAKLPAEIVALAGENA